MVAGSLASRFSDTRKAFWCVTFCLEVVCRLTEGFEIAFCAFSGSLADRKYFPLSRCSCFHEGIGRIRACLYVCCDRGIASCASLKPSPKISSVAQSILEGTDKADKNAKEDPWAKTVGTTGRYDWHTLVSASYYRGRILEIVCSGSEWLSMGWLQLTCGAHRAENRCSFDLMLARPER